jgi:hypothetical protein
LQHRRYLTRPFVAYRLPDSTRQAFDRAKKKRTSRHEISLSAGKIMDCFDRQRRRRKVATGREYRVFGILFVCVAILPITLVSQPTAGADRPQAALPVASVYSDNVVERSAPNWKHSAFL